MAIHHPTPLPGFRLAFGITMTMLSLVVLIPIGALILRGVAIGPAELWTLVASERVCGSHQAVLCHGVRRGGLQPGVRAGSCLGADTLPLSA